MTTKPIVIIIRNITRLDRKCDALNYTLAEMESQLTKANACVSEHDIDVEFGLIRKYGITSVPTLLFERNGAEITRITGLATTEEILDAVDYAKVTP